MRRFLLRWWPGTCLLVPLLTGGCQHNRSCCTPCCTPPVEMGAPVAVPSMPPAAADASAQPAEPVLPAVNTSAPVIHTAAKPARPPVADPMLSQAPPPPPSLSHPSTAAQLVPPASVPASEPEETVAAGPRFAHDRNYHWLVGTLEYSRIQQAWLLRYVPFEEEDRYGGCVTLVTTSRLSFKPGQLVRVEGALIDPESQQLRPAFEVTNIRAQ